MYGVFCKPRQLSWNELSFIYSVRFSVDVHWFCPFFHLSWDHCSCSEAPWGAPNIQTNLALCCFTDEWEDLSAFFVFHYRSTFSGTDGKKQFPHNLCSCCVPPTDLNWPFSTSAWSVPIQCVPSSSSGRGHLLGDGTDLSCLWMQPFLLATALLVLLHASRDRGISWQLQVWDPLDAELIFADLLQFPISCRLLSSHQWKGDKTAYINRNLSRISVVNQSWAGNPHANIYRDVFPRCLFKILWGIK